MLDVLPQQHNLFGQLGPRCPACSGLGRVLKISTYGVTRYTSRCECGGSGVDRAHIEETRINALERQLHELQQRYMELLQIRDAPPPIIQNSRQYWMELISWATADGTAIASTTTETIIFPNVTIPGNYMQDGRALAFVLSGRVGATATPTLTWAVRWGGVSGTVIAQSAAVTVAAVTAAQWRLEGEIQTRANGSSGSVFCQGVVHWGATIKTTNTPDMLGSAGATTPAAVTVDLTADTALSFTADWSASSASNTLTGHNYFLESKN